MRFNTWLSIPAAACALAACVHYTATSSSSQSSQSSQPSAPPPPPSASPSPSGAAPAPVVVTASPNQPRTIMVESSAATAGSLFPMQQLFSQIVDMARDQCHAGNQRGCVFWALDYWYGNFVPQDRAKARELLRHACDAGEKSGCRALDMLAKAPALGTPSVVTSPDGTVVVSSPGVTVTESTSTSGGSSRVVTLNGAGGFTALSADVSSLVTQNLQTGCSAGNQSECISLGMMYAMGSFVPKDPARARQLYDGACRAGDASGCALLKQLQAQPAGH